MVRFIGLFALVTMVLAACGADDTANCIEVREPQDPNSILHTLDPESAVHLTDPPTSGPHVSGPAPVGVLENSLLPAVQVNVLEAGSILVQYDDSIDVDALSAVAEQADAEIVIAPGVGLPSPVVATAWTWKLTCGSVDVDAIVDFADLRQEDAPEDD